MDIAAASRFRPGAAATQAHEFTPLQGRRMHSCSCSAAKPMRIARHNPGAIACNVEGLAGISQKPARKLFVLTQNRTSDLRTQLRALPIRADRERRGHAAVALS